MNKHKTTTSPQSKANSGSGNTTMAKKRKDVEQDPKQNDTTKVHPEEYEEFSHEIPDEEKTGEANEVKSNETDQNENKP